MTLWKDSSVSGVCACMETRYSVPIITCLGYSGKKDKQMAPFELSAAALDVVRAEAVVCRGGLLYGTLASAEAGALVDHEMSQPFSGSTHV